MKTLAIAAVAIVSFASSAVAAELPAALIQPYLKMQVLLSSDDIKGLADAAKGVETAAATLGKDGEVMAASAKKLVAAKTIADARKSFGDLSEALVGYAEKTKATLPADLHIAYCPMEDKHWMQKGKDIKNPYYGASMLDCGSIKK